MLKKIIKEWINEVLDSKGTEVYILKERISALEKEITPRQSERIKVIHETILDLLNDRRPEGYYYENHIPISLCSVFDKFKTDLSLRLKEEYMKDLAGQVAKVIASESFIDTIVKRIKDKQL